ncbi:phytoene desaturase family protein [Alteribacter natronophilus]|uniref:phytoene desaturase family protein n=1 Tax=Alteribacter natronophilus TaxID=2583810 RepID=UPI00110E6EF9|nr:phytoene desaturase family protein [Alteribacter natronophilus]TMW73065.1 phytoene desaturase [Alteribacter natronophilus]
MGKKRVAVIGGGLGGLSAAISLASDGHEVKVLEKNERAGGKLNQRSGKGYTFDTGPSILTMPWVLEKLFKSAGRDLSDYMTITRIEPGWRCFFEDGTCMDMVADIPQMLHELKQVNPADARKYFDYLQYTQDLYELCRKSFYKESISGLSELRQLHSLKELLGFDPMRTVADGTGRYFKDKRIQQMFNFLAMYVGSSPYHAPAVLSQLAYVQLGIGVHYVEGGMYNIARGMLKLLDELGAEVVTDAEVTGIVTEGNRASGVELADGTVEEADLIVSNLEVIPAYESLVEPSVSVKRAAELEKDFIPSVSGLVLLLGVNRKYPQLAHHNFFFAEDMENEFRQIYDDGVPADDPTVYIGVSAKSDSSQAPEGKENLFVLTHVPPLKKGESWEEYRESYREKVIAKLERQGLTGLREAIEFEYQFIPDDLQSLYGANGGSIYGVAADKKKNGGFKIPSRSDLYDNLYFVGGSTHPGGGVPMVTLSGQLTADLIKKNLAEVNV